MFFISHLSLEYVFNAILSVHQFRPHYSYKKTLFNTEQNKEFLSQVRYQRDNSFELVTFQKSHLVDLNWSKTCKHCTLKFC